MGRCTDEGDDGIGSLDLDPDSVARAHDGSLCEQRCVASRQRVPMEVLGALGREMRRRPTGSVVGKLEPADLRGRRRAHGKSSASLDMPQTDCAIRRMCYCKSEMAAPTPEQEQQERTQHWTQGGTNSGEPSIEPEYNHRDSEREARKFSGKSQIGECR